MKKIILLNQINFLNLPILFLFSFFGYKFYYFEIQEMLKNEKLINFLSKKKITWVDYNKFHLDPYNYYKKLLDDVRSSSNLLVKKIWSKKIKEIFLNKNNFRLCLSDEIFHKLSKNNELLLLASSLLESKQIRELYILLDFNLLNYYLKKNYKKKNFLNKNVKIILFYNFFNTYRIFLKVIITIFNFIFRTIKSKINKTIIKSEQINLKNESLQNCRSIYFPNKGSINNFESKTFFYSSKYKFLKPHNLLHLEHVDEFKLSNTVNKFYKKNKIKTLPWGSIEKKFSFFAFFNIFLFNLSLLINKTNLFELILISKIIYKLKYHLKIFKHFKSLKVILIGHLDIFPNTICVAARINNIKTISFQTRLLQSAMLVRIKCIDQYFCIGQTSKLNLKSYDNQLQIKKIFPLYYKTKKKIKIIKKCLIMPYSVSKNWYNDGRSISVSNKHIYEFFEKIHLIALKEKKINFLIKLKHKRWNNYHDLVKIIKKLNRLKNVKLKYNYALKENDLLNFDFVIGQPNKSLENSINMNIPTLIYETPKEMYSKWIKDYDKDILCNNNNIYKKFKTIKKNLYAFQNKIKKQKNCLFYKSDFSKYNLIKKDINDLCQK